MAQTFGIDRQPTQLDYASPTQFKFSIVKQCIRNIFIPLFGPIFPNMSLKMFALFS